jgi:hypothetical protein
MDRRRGRRVGSAGVLGGQVSGCALSLLGVGKWPGVEHGICQIVGELPAGGRPTGNR